MQAGLDGFPARARHKAEQLSGSDCLARHLDQVGDLAEVNGIGNAALCRATRKHTVRELQILSWWTYPSNTTATSLDKLSIQTNDEEYVVMSRLSWVNFMRQTVTQEGPDGSCK